MSTEPDIARDAGSLNFNEVHKILNLRMAFAQKRGEIGLYSDLCAIANFIDDQQEKLDQYESSLRPMEVVFHVPNEPPESRPRALVEDDE